MPLTQTSKSQVPVMLQGYVSSHMEHTVPFLLRGKSLQLVKAPGFVSVVWGSNPDSPCNLFTASLLYFLLQPSCFPERELDVSIGLSKAEGDTI